MKIITFKEKHGTRIFVSNSKEDIAAICLKILKERVRGGRGNWYQDDDYDEAESAMVSGNSAYSFLNYRSGQGYEYEDMDINEPEEF